MTHLGYTEPMKTAQRNISIVQAARRLGLTRQRVAVFCREGRFLCKLVTHPTGFKSWEIDPESFAEFARKKRPSSIRIGLKK